MSAQPPAGLAGRIKSEIPEPLTLVEPPRRHPLRRRPWLLAAASIAVASVSVVVLQNLDTSLLSEQTPAADLESRASSDEKGRPIADDAVVQRATAPTAPPAAEPSAAEAARQPSRQRPPSSRPRPSASTARATTSTESSTVVTSPPPRQGRPPRPASRPAKVST